MAYLLRLWQVEEGKDAPWRASLESPQSGERQGFTNLGSLFAFLEKKVGEIARDPPPPGREEKGGDSEI